MSNLFQPESRPPGPRTPPGYLPPQPPFVPQQRRYAPPRQRPVISQPYPPALQPPPPKQPMSRSGWLLAVAALVVALLLAAGVVVALNAGVLPLLAK